MDVHGTKLASTLFTVATGAHALAARSGRYMPVTTWRVENGDLVGDPLNIVFVGDITTRLSVVAGHTFKTEGKVLTAPGWLEVYGKATVEDDAPDSKALPALAPAEPPTVVPVLNGFGRWFGADRGLAEIGGKQIGVHHPDAIANVVLGDVFVGFLDPLRIDIDPDRGRTVLLCRRDGYRPPAHARRRRGARRRRPPPLRGRCGR